MLTLTWQRLMWKRYVSSQSNEVHTNQTCLFYTLQIWHICLVCLTLPSTDHHPLFLSPFSFPDILYLTVPHHPQALTFNSAVLKDSKDSVTAFLLPATLCKSFHYLRIVCWAKLIAALSPHYHFCASIMQFTVANTPWKQRGPCVHDTDCAFLFVLWIIHYIHTDLSTFWSVIYISSSNNYSLLGL